ncbi:hypothetical protein TNCV_3407801 [Trichonephila clavipes]|nr:hypothetical protein TNCV_3407801 [Trichonephila clavipes]
MIWAKCPKEIFVNKRRVKRAVTEAVCKYNKGTVRTIVETQKALGVATGGSTKQLATILDCRKQKFRKRRQNAKKIKLGRTILLERGQAKSVRRRNDCPAYYDFIGRGHRFVESGRGNGLGRSENKRPETRRS